VATSDTGVVRKIADQAAILDHGRVLERGGLLELLHDPNSLIAESLLPAITREAPVGKDRIADVVLIGFAAVGALLPEAGSRFGVDISIVGGGLTRFGETPVARFRLGVNGERADAAIGWIEERGGLVRPALTSAHGVAA
jgi:D-methionine transport system ATP-binding protein